MAGGVVNEIKGQKKMIFAVIGLIAVIFLGFYLLNTGKMNVVDDILNENSSITYPNSNNSTNQNTNTSTAENNSKNNKYSSEPVMSLKPNTDYQAEIVTDKGTIVVDLYEEDTPRTVNSFVFLANDDFFDGLTFHRVFPNFVIQGGDPLGTGMGGPGYKFINEIVTKYKFEPYVLAMANAGANTNGSQFFITTGTSKGSIESLDGDYTIFGKVLSGQSVVDAIAQTPADPNSGAVTGVKPVITTINILEK
ncbi:MAG TPA: peptidylprolyl isomerase [Candidatus Dojkabacteria bacterium]|nr:peptidylprolyl isomerase [Candidatus Dojkabacteria bacterium]